MAVHKDLVQIKHELDNKGVIDKLALAANRTQELVDANKDLDREYKKLSRAKKQDAEALAQITKKYRENILAIQASEKALLKEGDTLDLTASSANKLSHYLTVLKKNHKGLIPGTDEYTRSLQRQEQVMSEVAKRTTQNQKKTSSFDKVSDNIPAAIAGAFAGGAVAIGIAAIDKTIQGVSNLITKTAELSDQFSDIKKTTGLTDAEVRKLNTSFKDFDTRTANDELRKLASEAGKLGKTGYEDIRRFVEEANQIKVALGEDLGENAVIEIQKISDAFGVGALQTASAINSLGASSAATESYLVEFGTRLSGTAKTAQISIPDILAYGATFDSLGLNVESSATALSQFFIDFVKNSSKFEQGAGFQQGALKKLIGEKGTNEGFIAFIDKLRETSSSSEQFLQKLESMGVTGARESGVFLALSENIQKVRDQQTIANTEFQAGTSILNEYNEKNNNLAGILERISKAMNTFFSSKLLASFFESSVIGFGKLIGVVSDTQLAIDDFNRSKTTLENNERSVNSLVGEYEKLKSKTLLNKDEQERLRNVINQIANIVPSAVTQFNEYGEAMGINTNIAKEYIVIQKEMLKYKNKLAIGETEDELKRKKIALKGVLSTLKEGKEYNSGSSYGGIGSGYSKLTDNQLKQENQRRLTLIQEIESLENLKKGLNGEILDIPAKKTPTNPTNPLFGNGSGTGGSSSTSKINQRAEEAKRELEQERKIQNELQQIRAEIAFQEDLRTANDEEAKILALEQTANKKLEQIRHQFDNEEKLTVSMREKIRIETELAERELGEAVLKVREEYTEKRTKQYEEAVANALKAENEFQKNSLERKLKIAEDGKDIGGIANAKIDILNFNEQAEKDQLTAKYLQEQKLYEDNQAALLVIYETYQKQIEAITKQYADKRTDVNIVSELDWYKELAKTSKAQKEQDDATTQAGKDATDTKRQQIIATLDKFGEVANAGAELANALIERQIAKEVKHHNERLTQLEQQKNKGIISEEEYQKTRQHYEAETAKKQDELRRKQAIAQKANNIAQAVISGIQAVLSTLGQTGIFGVPLTPIVAGIAAANVARMVATPIPYEDGGFTGKGSKQSLGFKKPTPTAELAWVNERGKEYIVPNYLLQQPAVADMVSMIENKRVAGYYTGGYTSSSSQPPTFSAPTQNSTSSSVTTNDLLISAIVALSEKMDQPIKAYWEHDAMQRYTDRVSQIKKDSLAQ